QAQLFGLGAGRLRCRYCDDVQAGADPLGQKLDEVACGRAGAKPKPHPGFHEIKRARGSVAFQNVGVHDPITNSAPPVYRRSSPENSRKATNLLVTSTSWLHLG